MQVDFPTFTMRQKYAVARRVCLEKQSSTQIKTEVNLLCTRRTVYNVLQKNCSVRYAKLRSRPPLTKYQKKLRLEITNTDFFGGWGGGLDGCIL